MNVVSTMNFVSMFCEHCEHYERCMTVVSVMTVVKTLNFASTEECCVCEQADELTLINKSTMSSWPSVAATCRGVLSTLVRASLLMPALSSTSAVEQ